MAGFLNAIGAWFEKITDGWIFGTSVSKLKFTKNVELEGTDVPTYTHEFQDKDGILAHLDDIPKIYVNVDDYNAIGNGIVDDTTAWNNAITSSPAGSVIVGTKGKTYMVTTVNIDKEITLDLTGITIRRSVNVAVGSESDMFNTAVGAYNIHIRNGKIEFTGSHDDSISGKVNGFNFQNDNVFVIGTKIEGFSWCGIQSQLAVKEATFIGVESHDNGYAGIWVKGNRIIGVACRTHRNGGYNGIDGYGFVGNQQTSSEDEYFNLTNCHAFENMSRGLDSHSSRGSVIITGGQAVNNGKGNPKWDNVVKATARQIHCVNRFNACQIKDNYVRSEYATGSLINVTAEDSFTYGLKLLDIQGNTCDVLNDNVDCYGISVQYKLTEKMQVSNNTVKHSGTAQIYSIIIEGVPGSSGWFEDASFSNNICDKGFSFRTQTGHPTVIQNINFGNNTVSYALFRLSESAGIVNLQINNPIIKEKQITVYGHTNLLSTCKITGGSVDAYLDSSAFEGAIYLRDINGSIESISVKNAWAQGILATGGRVDVKDCEVIKANRGKLSASHAGIDVTGSIVDCYADNEDVVNVGVAYGYGFRCSAYDMTKTFSGNRIKIASANFARMNMSAVGLGTNVIYGVGIKLSPNDKEFRINHSITPDGIFRALDEVHDNNPNSLTLPLKSICTVAIDRTLISPSTEASTNVNVDSTSIEVGDRLGLILDDSTYHWATVTVIVNATNVTISAAIPTGRSASGAAYFRRWRGYGYSRTNFPYETPMLNISGLAGSGNSLPVGLNWVNVTDGLSSNYPSAIGTSLIVKGNNNRTFELFANTEGLFWMRSLHQDATNNIWKRLQDNTNVGVLTVQTIATGGKINNQSIWSDARVLAFTTASGISGIFGPAVGRELIIENRTGGDFTIHEEDVDSSSVNRFGFGIVIPNGRCIRIVYLNGKWRLAGTGINFLTTSDLEPYLKAQTGYNASVAQYFTHDASGNFLWVNI